MVEEVGFEKIRKKLRKLKSLKIVLVDGLQVAQDDPENLIADTCPSMACGLNWRALSD